MLSTPCSLLFSLKVVVSLASLFRQGSGVFGWLGHPGSQSREEVDVSFRPSLGDSRWWLCMCCPPVSAGPVCLCWWTGSCYRVHSPCAPRVVSVCCVARTFPPPQLVTVSSAHCSSASSDSQLLSSPSLLRFPQHREDLGFQTCQNLPCLTPFLPTVSLAFGKNSF